MRYKCRSCGHTFFWSPPQVETGTQAQYQDVKGRIEWEYQKLLNRSGNYLGIKFL